jgi:hypothetical protein
LTTRPDRRAHAGQHRLEHGQGAEHIDLELGADFLQRGLFNGAHKVVAGVVDHYLDRSEPAFDRGDHVAHALGVSDVRDES